MLYFIKYCFYCLLIPIIVLVFNIFIDLREFVNKKSYFVEELVKDLEYNNLVYDINVPERRIVKKRIEKTIKGLNNIFIGFSTSMLIGKENRFNYLNLGVSGFTLEDMSHLFDLFISNHTIIDTLMIGLNP